MAKSMCAMARGLEGRPGGTPPPGTFKSERILSSRMPIAAVWEVVSSLERRLDRGLSHSIGVSTLIYVAPWSSLLSPPYCSVISLSHLFATYVR